jgi:hypothetical protein
VYSDNGAANGPVFHPDTGMNMEQWWNDIDRKTKGLGEKPVLVSLCPPQIPLDWPEHEPGSPQ